MQSIRAILVSVVALSLVACDRAPEGNGETPQTGETEQATPTESPTSQASCSAAEVSVQVPDDDLPAEVAAIRREIIEAALRCDYDELAEIAKRPNGSFQYSRTEESAGPESDPAAFWRAREEEGDRTLASLVEILITDPETQPVTDPEGPGTGSDETYFNFPGPNVPDELTQYNTSITSGGDWIYFLGPEPQ